MNFFLLFHVVIYLCKKLTMQTPHCCHLILYLDFHLHGQDSCIKHSNTTSSINYECLLTQTIVLVSTPSDFSTLIFLCPFYCKVLPPKDRGHCFVLFWIHIFPGSMEVHMECVDESRSSAYNQVFVLHLQPTFVISLYPRDEGIIWHLSLSF